MDFTSLACGFELIGDFVYRAAAFDLPASAVRRATP